MNQLEIYENKGGITPIFDSKKLDLLKNTICKGSTNEEFELFLHACQRTGLDPFMKQIYAVKRRQKLPNGSYAETMTIQTGIDGYRLIAERTGKYSPGRESTYQYDQEGKIISCTSYIKKQTSDGSWHEIAATAFFSEYVQTYLDKETRKYVPTQFWQKMGHTMIAKCAEALALRKAFPGDLSGLYTKEEMMQAEVEDVTNFSQNKNDTSPRHVVDHIVDSNVMIDNTSKTVIDQFADVKNVVENNTENDFVKYISKSQIKMFNEKYDMISNPSSEYHDKKTSESIDNAISQLNIDGFPSIEKMQEKDWARFMKGFDRFFERKKVGINEVVQG